MLRILSREEATPRVSGFFLKAVIQALLIFRSGDQVVTTRMGKALRGFQAQVTRRLIIRLLCRTPYGKWTYTLEATARDEDGLLTTEEYTWRCQNTVAQYIDTQLLLDLCEGSERAPGT